MGVAEGRVGEQQRLLLADPAGELLGAQLLELLPRAVGGGGAMRSNGGTAPARAARRACGGRFDAAGSR